ncbi:hypothetical protein GGI21_004660, partial [Coemansia aciculifera]
MFTRIAERSKAVEDAREAAEAKPIPPGSVYDEFRKDNFGDFVEDNPDMNDKELGTGFYEMWDKLDDAVRQTYVERVSKQKKKYNSEVAAYNTRNPHTPIIPDNVCPIRGGNEAWAVDTLAEDALLAQTSTPSTTRVHSLQSSECRTDSVTSSLTVPHEHSEPSDETCEPTCPSSVLACFTSHGDAYRPSFPSNISSFSALTLVDSPVPPQLPLIGWPTEIMMPSEPAEVPPLTACFPVGSAVSSEYPTSSIHSILSGLTAIAVSAGAGEISEQADIAAE